MKTWFIKKIWKKNIYVKLKNVIEFLEEKYDVDKVNLKPLLKYSPDKDVNIDESMDKLVKKMEKMD